MAKLVSVGGFKRLHEDVREWAHVDGEQELLDSVPPNLDVGDIQLCTPVDELQTKIQQAVAPPANADDQPQRTPQPDSNLVPLLRNTTPALASLKESALKDRAHRARQQQNFLSVAMQGVIEEEGDRLEEDEVLVSVSVHCLEKGTKLQEFLVAGCNALTDLRDRLYCLEDHILCGPEIKSSYFLIEGVFYSDMRHPDNLDYAEEIVQHSPQWGFGRKRMEHTRFQDLSVVLGRHYLFCHQGNHEHRIVFNQIRFASPTDNPFVGAYPLHVFQSRLKTRKCRVCEIHAAKFVCYDDKLAPETPCFFCEACYHALHYDAAGQLLYSDFKVFPYYHE